MSYKKPEKTFQMRLSDEAIAEKLKEYVAIDDVNIVPINTHIRYYLIDSNKIKHFRMGGYLIKINVDAGYIALSNGCNRWSVQLNTAILYRKKTEDELNNDINQMMLRENKKIKDSDKKYKLAKTEYTKLKEKFIQLYDKYKALKIKHEAAELLLKKNNI